MSAEIIKRKLFRIKIGRACILGYLLKKSHTVQDGKITFPNLISSFVSLPQPSMRPFMLQFHESVCVVKSLKQISRTHGQKSVNLKMDG